MRVIQAPEPTPQIQPRVFFTIRAGSNDNIDVGSAQTRENIPRRALHQVQAPTKLKLTLLYEFHITKERHPITMKARSKDHKPDYVPGPGAYDPNFNKVAKNEPSYKLPLDKKLSAVEMNTFVPGPGSYNTISEGLSKHGIRFGSQKRLGIGMEKNVPGPGAYHDEKQALLLNSLPKYSFGTSERAADTNVRSPGRNYFIEFSRILQHKGRTRKQFTPKERIFNFHQKERHPTRRLKRSWSRSLQSPEFFNKKHKKSTCLLNGSLRQAPRKGLHHSNAKPPQRSNPIYLSM